MMLVSGACANDPTEIRVVDLLKQVGHAEKRPASGSFQLGEHTLGGVARASLIAPAASRLTWRLAFPRRATLRADIGVPASDAGVRVNFRIGISDGRVYETLAERVVGGDSAAGWVPLSVDLSRYAGPQRSLFYRPDGRTWELVLATNVVAGAPPAALWGAPGIDADGEAARRFFQRRTGTP